MLIYRLHRCNVDIIPEPLFNERVLTGYLSLKRKFLLWKAVWLPHKVSQGMVPISSVSQCWTNIDIWTEYEYIRVSNFHRIRMRISSGFKFSPNINTNIYRFQNFTEYEYGYIRASKLYRIRIYLNSKFSPNTNIFRFQIFPEFEYIWGFYKQS